MGISQRRAYGSNKSGQNGGTNDDKGKDCSYLGLGDYTEKAGVGGSTPSLATIIPKNLDESPCASPVRSQSASRTWYKETNAYVHVLEELISNCLPIQSAVSPFLSGAWLRIAVFKQFTAAHY
jgi:hypothetical protein